MVLVAAIQETNILIHRNMGHITEEDVSASLTTINVDSFSGRGGAS